MSFKSAGEASSQVTSLEYVNGLEAFASGCGDPCHDWMFRNLTPIFALGNISNIRLILLHHVIRIIPTNSCRFANFTPKETMWDRLFPPSCVEEVRMGKLDEVSVDRSHKPTIPQPHERVETQRRAHVGSWLCQFGHCHRVQVVDKTALRIPFAHALPQTEYNSGTKEIVHLNQSNLEGLASMFLPIVSEICLWQSLGSHWLIRHSAGVPLSLKLPTPRLAALNRLHPPLSSIQITCQQNVEATSTQHSYTRHIICWWAANQDTRQRSSQQAQSLILKSPEKGTYKQVSRSWRRSTSICHRHTYVSRNITKFGEISA